MAKGQSAPRAALRVSTDAETVENQIQELRQVAERRGWEVVEVYKDAGISGAKGAQSATRPRCHAQGRQPEKFDVIMAWAIDRLGRPSWLCWPPLEHLNGVGGRPSISMSRTWTPRRRQGTPVQAQTGQSPNPS